MLVDDEREGAGNEIIYASRDDEYGWTRESVPTFYWLFLEEYVIGYSVSFILCF